MNERRIAMTRAEASERLHRLMHSEKTRWWYAYAMGGGCTMESGGNEVEQAIRDEVEQLRSIIRGDR